LLQPIKRDLSIIWCHQTDLKREGVFLIVIYRFSKVPRRVCLLGLQAVQFLMQFRERTSKMDCQSRRTFGWFRSLPTQCAGNSKRY